MRVGNHVFHPGNLLLFVLPVFFLIRLDDVDHGRTEAGLLALSVVASLLLGYRRKWSVGPPVWTVPLRRWSRRPVLACLLPALASVALRVALLPWMPVPNPVVPDEYSHLFLAKTFWLGRLANPTHPLWQHFETLHIIPQPTFSSMYLAGQASFLALGKALTGNEFGGVLISTALMCAAITWFLRAYVPPGWAMLGGVFAAVRFGAASYWNNSYWGGSVAALGAALALGAYPRLVRSWKPVPASAFLGGLLLLLNTRPWEGFALGVVLAVGLAVEIARQRKRLPWPRVRISVVVALALTVPIGWAMSRHFKAATGDPFTLPYQMNQRIYGWPMSLPWFAARAVEHRHAELAQYLDWEMREHQQITDLAHVPAGLMVKFYLLWRFFFGVTGLVAFLFADRVWRARRSRVIWLAAGAVVLSLAIEQTGYPHYAAPAAPAFVLFFVNAIRRLRHCGFVRTAWGRPMAYAALLLPLAILGIEAARVEPGGPASGGNFFSWCCLTTNRYDRQPLLNQLNAEPGRHLVLVRHDRKEYDAFEWVYNDPDIDNSRIGFARDMGTEKNEELLRYYQDRRVWSVLLNGREAVVAETPRR